jgi:hypothetical protein
VHAKTTHLRLKKRLPRLKRLRRRLPRLNNINPKVL